MSSPTGIQLRGIWAAGVGDVFAVGQGTLLHYDGQSWSQLELPAEVSKLGLTSISGVDPKHFVVAGDSSACVFSDGWKGCGDAGTGVTVFNSAWMAAPDRAFAVGTTILTRAIGRFDGQTWNWSTAGSESAFTAVSGNRAGEVYAATALAKIYTLSGTSWTLFATLTGPVETGAQGLWSDASGEVVVAGLLASKPYLGRYRATWMDLALPTSLPPKALTSVWGADTDHMFAAGQGGMLLACDASSCVETQSQRPAVDFFSISGTSALDVFAVGDNGQIWRYTGQPGG
jgi:hypothetical protein